MHLRNIPWRFLLPGVIFPMSIASWVQYCLSLRASDDSPAPWSWYGGQLSAWLNFPAFIYSAPAQAFFRFGIRVGKLRVEPRIVTFFLFVFVFWYWVGTRVESWAAQGAAQRAYEKPSRLMHILYALGAALWILVVVGTAHDLASMVHVSSWYGLRYVYRDSELISLSQCLWSVILAVYYSRKFVRRFRGSATT
jgi:hypothetical protein